MKKTYFLMLALGLFTSVEAQIINIPDANFKAKLLGANINNGIAGGVNGSNIKIDTNNNGQIEITEASSVYHLWIHDSNIYDLSGIGNFTNLRKLVVFNNHLSNLNITGLSNLVELRCENNDLGSLNLNGLNNLKILYCGGNDFTSLNLSGVSLTELAIGECPITTLDLTSQIAIQEVTVSGCDNLTSINLSGLLSLNYLDCEYNPLLSSLNLSGLVSLKDLDTGNSGLTNLNLSGCSALKYLSCEVNQLTSLNLSSCVNLQNFYCRHNNLETLDLSNSRNLQNLWCDFNPLESIFLKNGSSIGTSYEFQIGNIPNLSYICVDTDEAVSIQNLVDLYGYTNCQVNPYCSFVPGGTFYKLQGNHKWDSNNNGCDVADLLLPNLKFNITDGTTTRNIISNTSGSYSISVQAGTQTVTPILENPNYFIVSPSSSNVTFPAQTSPLNKNFCIRANGIKKDLEVVLLPLTPTRPGSDTKFKIIYKNKGTVTQSGSVVMDYFGHVADFVSSVPALSSESENLLTWNYTNLKPFEVREITFTVNINNPMETPAVNNGDIISFEAYVYPLVGDLTTSDNHSGIRQVVVGSYDPNDKTCLEGNTITPDKVGEYVHYMIRFENTGTFPAENIVVKDMIDATKFDVSSIIPIKGSHSFVTNITDGNKVEFIFENINLPFDDANNDGYVAFKIKTKPTLVNGDTFSNTASIYFDYNFPIVTNMATTTIAALAVQDFEFSNYFSVYPNPVHDILNITSTANIEVSSISIYNTLGQLVLVIPNAKDSKTVDVSGLAEGSYFIKINSDKGTSNTKFVKN